MSYAIIFFTPQFVGLIGYLKGGKRAGAQEHRRWNKEQIAKNTGAELAFPSAVGKTDVVYGKRDLSSQLEVIKKSSDLFVPIVEDGYISGQESRTAIKIEQIKPLLTHKVWRTLNQYYLDDWNTATTLLRQVAELYGNLSHAGLFLKWQNQDDTFSHFNWATGLTQEGRLVFLDLIDMLESDDRNAPHEGFADNMLLQLDKLLVDNKVSEPLRAELGEYFAEQLAENGFARSKTDGPIPAAAENITRDINIGKQFSIGKILYRITERTTLGNYRADKLKFSGEPVPGKYFIATAAQVHESWEVYPLLATGQMIGRVADNFAGQSAILGTPPRTFSTTERGFNTTVLASLLLLLTAAESVLRAAVGTGQPPEISKMLLSEQQSGHLGALIFIAAVILQGPQIITTAIRKVRTLVFSIRRVDFAQAWSRTTSGLTNSLGLRRAEPQMKDEQWHPLAPNLAPVNLLRQSRMQSRLSPLLPNRRRRKTILLW